MKRILPQLEVMFKDILQIKTQRNNDETIIKKMFTTCSELKVETEMHLIKEE